MGSLVVLGAVTFDDDAWSVGVARRYVEAILTDAALDAEAAALVTSELCTNAIEHGGSGRFGLLLAADHEIVRIEVTDTGRGEGPQLRAADSSAEDGRGLLLVDACSSSWGVRYGSGGTTVWADIPKKPLGGS